MPLVQAYIRQSPSSNGIPMRRNTGSREDRERENKYDQGEINRSRDFSDTQISSALPPKRYFRNLITRYLGENRLIHLANFVRESLKDKICETGTLKSSFKLNLN